MIEPLNRRDFVRLTSAGVAAASVSSVSRAQSSRGANDKLVIALIGCGGRGMSDATRFSELPNVEVAAVCDVDDARRGAAAKSLNVEAGKAFSDMRQVLDDQSIDAVIVATPDHWHSPASILACDAGKHVYVEKPISHNIREGRLLVEASARNKTLVQHGTQSRSTSTMIEAVKKLREGRQAYVVAPRVETDDEAAAARYIEARLSKFALEVAFNSKTTDWALSYDGRKNEPVTLPMKFPMLLAQGAEGIAVGLATKILPHNFCELIDASIKYLRGKKFEILPDFQTGGTMDAGNYNDGVRGGKIRVGQLLKSRIKKHWL